MDGSSDLYIYNQNNPIKAASPELTAQAQLLKEWSQRYQESPEVAAEWLQIQRSSYTDELQAVSAVLLTDYYLSNQNADLASSVLSEITAQQKLFLEPGTGALRKIQQALNGEKDQALAAEAFAELKSADPESKSVEHIRYLLQQRYGFEFDSDAEPIVSESNTDETILLENFPNPFNPSTVISYTIPEQSYVQLEVFDMTGRSVSTLVSEQQSAGNYEIPFNASRLSSAVYIYRLQVGDVVRTNKLTLIK